MRPTRYESLIWIASPTLADMIENRLKSEKIRYRMTKDTYFNKYVRKEVSSYMFTYNHAHGHIDRFEEWLDGINEYDYYDEETGAWR